MHYRIFPFRALNGLTIAAYLLAPTYGLILGSSSSQQSTSRERQYPVQHGRCAHPQRRANVSTLRPCLSLEELTLSLAAVWTRLEASDTVLTSRTCRWRGERREERISQSNRCHKRDSKDSRSTEHGTIACPGIQDKLRPACCARYYTPSLHLRNINLSLAT